MSWLRQERNLISFISKHRLLHSSLHSRYPIGRSCISIRWNIHWFARVTSMQLPHNQTKEIRTWQALLMLTHTDSERAYLLKSCRLQVLWQSCLFCCRMSIYRSIKEHVWSFVLPLEWWEVEGLFGFIEEAVVLARVFSAILMQMTKPPTVLCHEYNSVGYFRCDLCSQRACSCQYVHHLGTET